MKNLVSVVFILIILTGCSNWTQKNKEQTLAEGRKIVTALEHYKRENGVYPSYLAVLAPEYIPNIVDPSVGSKHWRYLVTKDGDNFYLWVSDHFRDGEAAVRYSTSARTWKFSGTDGVNNLP